MWGILIGSCTDGSIASVLNSVSLATSAPFGEADLVYSKQYIPETLEIALSIIALTMSFRL